MTDLQSVPKQRLRNSELADFTDFAKLLKKTEHMEKFQLLDKRGFELMEKRKIPAPQPTPIYKLHVMPMAWNISSCQLGLAAWLCPLPAPAHLLIS